MKYKYYLSGAITGIVNYKQYFDGFEQRLRECGVTEDIFNATANDMGADATWEDYMRFDIKCLMDSEMLVLLPNWKKSRGVKVEMDLCKTVGIPIIKFNDLIKQLKGGAQ